MTVKLLTEHHLELLNLKGVRTGLSESTLVKVLHGWKSCRGSFVIYLHGSQFACKVSAK